MQSAESIKEMHETLRYIARSDWHIGDGVISVPYEGEMSMALRAAYFQPHIDYIIDSGRIKLTAAGQSRLTSILDTYQAAVGGLLDANPATDMSYLDALYVLKDCEFEQINLEPLVNDRCRISIPKGRGEDVHKALSTFGYTGKLPLEGEYLLTTTEAQAATLRCLFIFVNRIG